MKAALAKEVLAEIPDQVTSYMLATGWKFEKKKRKEKNFIFNFCLFILEKSIQLLEFKLKNLVFNPLKANKMKPGDQVLKPFEA